MVWQLKRARRVSVAVMVGAGLAGVGLVGGTTAGATPRSSASNSSDVPIASVEHAPTSGFAKGYGEVSVRTGAKAPTNRNTTTGEGEIGELPVLTGGEPVETAGEVPAESGGGAPGEIGELPVLTGGEPVETAGEVPAETA